MIKNRFQPNSPAWIVVCEDAQWYVVRVTPQEIRQSTPHAFDPLKSEEVASKVKAEFAELGYAGEPVLLALGTCWCVAATLSFSSSEAIRKREALSYEFEACTPWSAEDIVLDYEKVGSSLLVVGVQVGVWSPLVRELEALDIRIESISPIARLSLQFFLRASTGMPKRYLILWRKENSVDCWLIDSGHPVDWRWLLSDEDTLSQSIGAYLLTERERLPVFGIGLSNKQKSALESIVGEPLCEVPTTKIEDLFEAGFHEATSLLAGKGRASIELRRDDLIVGDRYRSLRGYLVTVQIALVLMLTALTVSLWVQSNKMNQKSISARAAQAELFQGLFPQRRVPVGIRSQLKSELTRLQGMRGKSEAIPDAIESIDVLHRALASLPIEIRLRVSEVRIEDDRISIYGQVREHSDASRIVAELKKNGFDTPPPFTRRLRDFGFEFRISANHAVSKSEEDMGG